MTTSKPLTIVLAIQKIIALIKKVNRPKVRKLIGSVSSIKTGRTRVLSKPRISEVTSTDQYETKLSPGVSRATTIKINELKIQRKMSMRLLLLELRIQN